MNILVTYAIAAERVRIDFAGCQVRYCETGIGKVNAALAVYAAVREQRPDFVLNVGTAGSATQAVGSILACGRFLDRDMEKVKEFGVPYWYDFSADLARIDLCRWVDYSHVCNTGDSFVTEVIAQAVETASAQGWSRPLLAWLGVQRERARAAGDQAQADRVQRRMYLILRDPR